MKKHKSGDKIDLRQLFLGFQQTMRSELNTYRKNIKHPTTKGDGAESVWIKFFRKNLPKRYSIDKAIVIDYEGNTSHCIDVVIYDCQYTPFIVNEDSVKHIPVESVYAAFEAKQEINKKLLEYAGEKVESVRKLNKTTAPVVDKGVIKAAPTPFTILGGFLCLDNGWSQSIDGLKPFKQCLEQLTDLKMLNIGCVLSDKSFVQVNEPDGKVSTRFSTDDETLIFFFLKLVSELQKLGTVRPIDLNKYIDQLNSQ
ncbi:MAG TPA: DUF6602 domain-containing protein [Cytophagales bacterium]|nr:DUF6602 domain-containing protein [Cytophagales bacterium]